MAITKVKNKRTGEVVEVKHPEGASMDEIMSFANKQPAVDEWADYDVTQDMSGGDLFLAGIGKGMTDVARGAGQLLGVVDEKDIIESRARDKNLVDTGAGATGNVVGSIAATLPAALIPGANTMLGAGAIGAGLGALQPVVGEESRGQNALIGGSVGAAAIPLLGAASSVLAPQVNKAANLLNLEGVKTTIGQTLGGSAKVLEDKATSIPFIGRKIMERREEGYKQFNEAAVKRALNPVGEELPKGLDSQQALAHTRKTLGDKYDTLLEKMKGSVDPEFQGDMDNLFSMMETLPPEKQRYFSKIIDREINGRMTDAGLMSGQSLKDIEAALGDEIKKFKNSSGFDATVGDALKEAQKSFRGMIARQNPEYAKSLQNINKGYANFKIAQNAAGKIGADQGLFTPAQLHNAVRMKDITKDKRAFSEGDALMQDLSGAGKSVLPSTVPDSGTAGRLSVTNPLAALPATAAGFLARPLYSDAGMAFSSGMMGYRPASLRAAGGLLEKAKPYAAPVSQGLMDEEEP